MPLSVCFPWTNVGYNFESIKFFGVNIEGLEIDQNFCASVDYRTCSWQTKRKALLSRLESCLILVDQNTSGVELIGMDGCPATDELRVVFSRAVCWKCLYNVAMHFIRDAWYGFFSADKITDNLTLIAVRRFSLIVSCLLEKKRRDDVYVSFLQCVALHRRSSSTLWARHQRVCCFSLFLLAAHETTPKSEYHLLLCGDAALVKP